MGDGGAGSRCCPAAGARRSRLGRPWIGLAVQGRRASSTSSAEEDKAETHIRVAEIATPKASTSRRRDKLEIACLAGEDAVLADENRKGSSTRPCCSSGSISTLKRCQPAAARPRQSGRRVRRQRDQPAPGEAVHRDAAAPRTALRLRRHPARPSVAGRPVDRHRSQRLDRLVNSVQVTALPAQGRRHERRRGRPVGAAARNDEGELWAARAPIGLQWIARAALSAAIRPKPFDNVSTADLDKVQAGVRRGHYRVRRPGATDWGGYVVASILDLDVGRASTPSRGPLSSNCNRDNVKTVLATWACATKRYSSSDGWTANASSDPSTASPRNRTIGCSKVRQRCGKICGYRPRAKAPGDGAPHFRTLLAHTL